LGSPPVKSGMTTQLSIELLNVNYVTFPTRSSEH
jgi:hypothetical protein